MQLPQPEQHTTYRTYNQTTYLRSFIFVLARPLSSPGLRWPCFAVPLRGGWGMFYGPWEKTVMFLNAPYGRNPANAAKLLRRGFQPSAFVGHAARDGRIPAIRGIKKHHRFFPWSVKHPPAAPERNRKTGPSEAGRGQRPRQHKNKASPPTAYRP